MKKSHIDWCPVIPDHWEEKELKILLFFKAATLLLQWILQKKGNILSMGAMVYVVILITILMMGTMY